jgi:glucose/arabinose dehydrogenase
LDERHDYSYRYFVVAVHGSGNKSLGVGYKLLTIDQNTLQASDLITGFLQDGQVHGRTAAVLTNDPHSFFVTDDYNGAIYYVSH